MTENSDPTFLVREAQERQDPTILIPLFRFLTTNENALDLRQQLREVIVEPQHYETWFGWIMGRDSTIARSVAAIFLLLRDTDLCIEVFTKLTEMEATSIPFQVTYNSAEREFNLGLADFPGVPGWGVSHYGMDNPKTDQLLLALERYYAKAHQREVPPYFRK